MKFLEKLRVGQLTLKTPANGDANVRVETRGGSKSAVLPIQTDDYNFLVAGAFTALTGSATQAIPFIGFNASDIAFARMKTADDTDTLSSVISAAGKVTVVETADPLAAHSYDFFVLRQGAAPSHRIFAGGAFTTAGGDANEAIPVTGLLVSDIVITQVHTKGASPVTIVTSVAAAGQINVVMSADPSTDHIIKYMVLRSNCLTCTHFVVAAGSVAAVTGSATQTIAVTGCKATDIAFVLYNTTDDSDTITTAQAAAGQINVVVQNDPLAAHVFTYVVIRAM
jgi:hypothetical protein